MDRTFNTAPFHPSPYVSINTNSAPTKPEAQDIGVGLGVGGAGVGFGVGDAVSHRHGDVHEA